MTIEEILENTLRDLDCPDRAKIRGALLQLVEAIGNCPPPKKSLFCRSCGLAMAPWLRIGSTCGVCNNKDCKLYQLFQVCPPQP